MRGIVTVILVVAFALPCAAGTTITYSYDKQHRLTSADYSAAQTDAHMAYQYDAANNLDVEASITDGQYLKSFLYWLSAVWPDRLEPDWLRKAQA